MFFTRTPLILASGSPRRRELLTGLGLAFSVLPGLAPEPDPLPGESPQDYAQRAAVAKAREIAPNQPRATVLAADTVVALDRDILGKPASDAEALDMLTRLAGRTHVVVTGCHLLGPVREGATAEARPATTFAVTTEVDMVRHPTSVLAAYVATGEPRDKAGAYAIQGRGAFLVAAVRGSHSNVIGLPLAEVLEVLVSWGIVVPRTR